jgi:dTDP-4-dehydrorhamnose 3,5-epimerase
MSEVAISDILGVHFTNCKTERDTRGSMYKFYQSAEEGNPAQTFQVDSLLVSSNRKVGTLRGMHFQGYPFQEEKIITCISGKILDVIVDLRPNSATFGNWSKIILDGVDPRAIYLPKGLAHGFQTLERDTKVLYAISTRYVPNNSYVLSHADSSVGIVWPLKISAISKKDTEGLNFEQAVRANVEP